MNIFICFLLSFILLVQNTVMSTDVDDAEPRPCPIAYKCSNEESIVWATDGRRCYVNRNDCDLRNENCQRQNRYDEVLREVSKEECQKLCSSICTADFRPVCAQYNEVKRTFSNLCNLNSHICLSGETYSLLYNDSCGV